MAPKKNLVEGRLSVDPSISYFQKTDKQTLEQLDAQTSGSSQTDIKKNRAKLTVYVPKEVDVRLRELQVERLKSTGAKPELSELVTEAIKLLGRLDDQAS